MRSYDGSCQSEDIGMLDCACSCCVALRVLQADEFVAADKLRRSLFPVAAFDADGNLVVESGDYTMPNMDAFRVASEPPRRIGLLTRVARLLRVA